MQASQKPTINVIGAGKLGKTVARLIVTHQAGRIQEICNSSLESSIQAAEFIEEGAPLQRIDELNPADITFITGTR